MANTLYAAFNDAVLAERAAGALLDHGVRAEDLSLVQHESRYNMPTTVAEDTGVSPDARGEMSGARTDSPGVIGAGTYVPPMTSMANAMNDNDEVHAVTYMHEDDFSTARNQADFDRENPHAKDYKIVDVDKLEKSAKTGISTTTGADAGAAAITGGAVGLGVGAIAALASLLIPGIGLVVGGGALATAIGGIVATTGAGAAVGAVTGYLKDQGVEEHIAQKYGETVTTGGAILAVHVPSLSVDEAKARELLEKYGAANVNSYVYEGMQRSYVA